MNDKKEKILLLMSGGIDSSVAALLLKQQGYEVVGVTMQLQKFGKGPGGIVDEKLCTSGGGCTCQSPEELARHDRKKNCYIEDLADARRVAIVLGIDHRIVPLEDEFKRYVLDYFVDEYVKGRTPNPCVVCNDVIKFGFMLDYASKMGIEKIAAGHYARIIERGGVKLVARPKDAAKDQSYFLYRLSPEKLKRIVFPLAEHTKDEARVIAERERIGIRPNKPQSFDICFLPELDYRKFIERVAKLSGGGNFIDEQGAVIGRHEGYYRFTIGQRRGLGSGFGERAYVGAIDPVSGDVTLTKKANLMSGGLVVADPVLHLPLESDKIYEVKVRSRSKAFPARCSLGPDATLTISFVETVFSVAEGQSAVIYDDGAVIGGGFIAGKIRQE